MRTIAITNDDGYTEGVNILLNFSRRLGRAYALIPERQRSAISSAITLHKPLRIEKYKRGIYTLSGTPADCAVFIIYSKQFPKPDVLFSGINWGDNTGLSPLISSGTIGACWKATIHGVPSVAFSLYQRERRGWRKKSKWKNRKEIEKALEKVWKRIEPNLRKGTFYVVNLPSPEKLSSAKIIFPKDIQWIRSLPIIEKRADPHRNPYFWLGGRDPEIEKGTDFYEVAVNGNISIVRIELSRLANP